jgi:hypothetical protein
MVDEAGAYEDGSANGEDSGREFENLLAGRGTEESAEAAAQEEIIGTGGSCGVDDVDVLNVRAQVYEDDAEDE